MALRDFEEFSEKPLELPVNGKTYVVPQPDIAAGILLTDIVGGRESEFITAGPEELWKLVLGPVWDELAADKAGWNAVVRCGITALADFMYGREMAEAAWEKGSDPKALAEYMTAKTQRAGNRAQRRSKSTVAATKTR